MPRSDLRSITAAPMRSQRRPLAASASLSVMRIGVELLQPWPLAIAVDYAITREKLLPDWLPAVSPVGLLVGCAVAVIVLAILAGLLDMAATRSAEQAAERLGAELRRSVFNRVMALSLRWHDGLSSGELVSRLTTDIGRLLDAIVALTVDLVPNVLTLLGVLTLLVTLNPTLAGIGIAVLPLLAVLSVQQRRMVRASQQAARAESGRLAATTTDLLRNVRAVQAFGRADRAGGIFQQRNRSALDVAIRAVATEARWTPVSAFVLAIGSGFVLLVGGIQVIRGTHSVGELLVVLAYVRELYAPVRSLTRLSSVLAKASASATRVAEILECEESIREVSGAMTAPASLSRVQFVDVDFAYDTHHQVLRGFDLELAAGETVCLLGPSGCGKSTILHLLLRLYDVDGGQVLINGADIRRYDLRSLRERIAFVPQDPWLLDGTIAQNIAFGSRTATRAEVVDAGRRARVDEFTDRLPLGYDNSIGEGGARLSGGQRRRIAIARAGVSTASLILLDEPTASLDAAAAAQVIGAIQASTARRTTLIVTHDAELARIADRVITLAPTAVGAAGREDQFVTSIERR